MKRRATPLLLLMVSLLWVAALPAAHITDRLLVGLYPEKSLQGEPLRLLPSGTPLQRLDTADQAAQVRLGDGTEGWLESSYLTDEKPARAVVLELQAELVDLRREMAPLPVAPAEVPSETTVEASPAPVADAADTATGVLAGEKADRPDLPIPLIWLAGLLGVAVGVLLGLGVMEYRIRSGRYGLLRHGG